MDLKKNALSLLAEVSACATGEVWFKQYQTNLRTSDLEDPEALSRCTQHALMLASMSPRVFERKDLHALTAAALILADKWVRLPVLKKLAVVLQRLQRLQREHTRSAPPLTSLMKVLEAEREPMVKIFRSVNSPGLEGLVSVAGTWAGHMTALQHAEHMLAGLLHRWHASEMIPGRVGPKPDGALGAVLRQLQKGKIGAKGRLRLIHDGGKKIGKAERFRHQMRLFPDPPYYLPPQMEVTVERADFDALNSAAPEK